MKETALGKLVSRAFGLGTYDKNRLIHYKNPEYHPLDSKFIGDFVFVSKSVISPLCTKKPSICLAELDLILEELSFAENSTVQLQIFTKLARKATIEELEWIFRILLKDLKLGLRHEKILPLFHPDALFVFNHSFSLLKVSQVCISPTKKVERCNVKLFSPVRPFLALRRTANQILNIFLGEEFFTETKYDGERIQLHLYNDQLRFYSRNCHDVTDLYEPHFKPFLIQNIKASAAIFDGELIVVDSSTLKPVEFGKNRSIALEGAGANQDFNLCCKKNLI